jgi:flagellin-like hook-associated protein FlgL
MPREYGDAPIQEEYRRLMEGIAGVLNKTFNGDAKRGERKTGFILLVFPFGEAGGRCNYISNGASRKDVVTMFKEQIAHFEGQPDIEGKA